MNSDIFAIGQKRTYVFGLPNDKTARRSGRSVVGCLINRGDDCLAGNFELHCVLLRAC